MESQLLVKISLLWEAIAEKIENLRYWAEEKVADVAYALKDFLES